MPIMFLSGYFLLWCNNFEPIKRSRLEPNQGVVFVTTNIPLNRNDVGNGGCTASVPLRSIDTSAKCIRSKCLRFSTCSTILGEQERVSPHKYRKGVILRVQSFSLPHARALLKTEATRTEAL